MPLDDKLSAAIDQSRDYAIKRMIEAGVPIGIDAIRCDVTYHTPHGWQPSIEGEIVRLPGGDGDDLPKASRASHSSS